MMMIKELTLHVLLMLAAITMPEDQSTAEVILFENDNVETVFYLKREEDAFGIYGSNKYKKRLALIEKDEESYSLELMKKKEVLKDYKVPALRGRKIKGSANGQPITFSKVKNLIVIKPKVGDNWVIIK